MKYLKTISIALLLLITITGVGWASMLTPSSRITEVTVYPDRALIKKVARIDLKPGSHTVVLAPLPAALIDSTVQIGGRGTAAVSVLSVLVSSKPVIEAPNEKIKELKAKIQALVDEDEAHQDNLNALKAKKKFVSNIVKAYQKSISEDIAGGIGGSAVLKTIHDFIGGSLNDIMAKGISIRIERRRVEREIRALRKELNKIKSPGRDVVKQVAVELDVSKPGKFVLELTYVQPGASWKPSYEFRADIKNGKLSIKTFGSIIQKTGEDWKNVKLTLSTARPSIGGVMPELQPWQLDFLYGKKKRKFKIPLPGMVAHKEMMKNGDVMDYEVAAVEDAGTAVNYVLERPTTIPSDGEPHKSPVTFDVLSATFIYAASPRLIEYAYLQAKIENTTDHPFSPGRASVFIGDDFVGNTDIGLLNPGQKTELSLGVDEGIVVKRKLKSKRTRDKSLFGKTLIDYSYEITAENYKPAAIKLVLREQLPVPVHKEIEVELEEGFSTPALKEEFKKSGIYLWEINLKPRQKFSLKYSYTVKYPSGRELEGME